MPVVEEKPWTKRGGGFLPADVEAEIQAKVEARTEAKKIKNYEEADAIRDALKAEHGVVLDDRSREWRVQNAGYAMAGNSAPLDDATKAEVEALVKERSQCKRDKDYGAADAIRDRLKADFDVDVDDRVREWCAGGGGGGGGGGAAGPAPVRDWTFGGAPCGDCGGSMGLYSRNGRPSLRCEPCGTWWPLPDRPNSSVARPAR